MTNGEDFAPYIHKTAKADAERIKRNLKGQYLKLKVQNDETEAQMNVALRLKTDLHLERLSEQFKLSRAFMRAMTDDVSKLLSLGEPDNSQTMQDYGSWEKEFKELSISVKNAEGEIGEAIANRQPAVPPDQGARGPAQIKANDPLKPKELQLDDKPSVLRLFKKEFQDYYESNRMGQLPVRVQQNYFTQCIGTKLKLKIRNMIRDTTPVLAVTREDPNDVEPDSCYKFLDDIFKAQHPMVRRRQDFFSYTQRPNQKTSDYIDKLKELFDEAELQQLRAEDLLTYKAIQGCTVEPARTKFCKEEEPTIKKLEKIAHTIESAENTLIGLPTSHVQANRVGGQGAKHSYQKPQSSTSSGSCGRCNGRDKSAHDKTTCRFKDVVCFTCGQKGHIRGAPFCRKNGPQESGSTKEEEATGAGCSSVQLYNHEE